MKKCLIWLMIFCCIIQAPVFAIDAVPDERYAHEIHILTNLGIVTGFNPENASSYQNQLTRGEFAMWVCKMTGLFDEAQAYKGQVYYTDTRNHEYQKYINMVTKAGYMVGIENKQFLPDGALTPYQASCVMLHTLGYKKVAAEMGYQQLISSTGIQKGVMFASNTAITREEAAALVYNTLHTDIATEDFFNEDVTISTERGVTLMNSRLHIYRARGIVTANQYTALNQPEGVGMGQLKIDDLLYYEGNSNAGSLLGSRVECYFYQEQNSVEREVLFAQPFNQEERTIFSHEIEDFTVQGRQLQYEEQGRLIKLKLSASIDYIYNGISRFEFDPESIPLMERYRLLLIDNNNDGVYDVLYIEEYDVMVVGGKDTSLLYGENNSGTVQIESGKSRILRNGQLAAFNDIAVGDSLLVAKNKDFLILYASDQKAEGKVEQIYEKEWVIDGTSYRMTQQFLVQNCRPNVGDNITLLLDFYGIPVKVAAMETKNDRIGYLVSAALRDDLASECYQFKIVENSYEAAVFLGTENMKLNGKKMTEESFRNTFFSEQTFLHQLVRFRTNSENEITALVTARDDTSRETPRFDNSVFTLDAQTAPEQTLYFNKTNRRLGNYFVSGNTPIFCIPKLEKGQLISLNTDKFKVTGVNDISNGEYGDVKIYNLSEYKIASAVVLSNPTVVPVFKGTVSAMVVDEVTQSVNGDNEVLYKVAGYVNGVMQEYFVPEDINERIAVSAYPNVKFEELKCGDIIQFFTDNRDMIASFKPMFIADRVQLGDMYEFGGEVGNREFSTEFNVLYKVGPGVMLVGNNFATARTYSTENAKIYIYETDKKQQVHPADTEELGTLFEGVSKVFVYSNWEKATIILAVK